jgi:hypothetical protein
MENDMNEHTETTRAVAERSGGATAVWSPFTSALAGVLERLQEDQYLVISIRDMHRFVQFAAQGAHGMRVETVSNQYLEAWEQLDDGQLNALRKLGWKDPTRPPPESTPSGDPHGSPNHFVDLDAPVAFGEVAELAVRTLADVLKAPHPGALAYEAFERGGDSLVLAELGLMRATHETAGEAFVRSQQRLVAILREATGLTALELDADGDIQVHYGNIVAFTRMVSDPLRVRIMSPVLFDVRPSSRLTAYLNDWNASGPWMRLHVYKRAVCARVELPASPMIAEHVCRVFHDFCRGCDELVQQLQGRFGGVTIHGAHAERLVLH